MNRRRWIGLVAVVTVVSIGAHARPAAAQRVIGIDFGDGTAWSGGGRTVFAGAPLTGRVKVGVEGIPAGGLSVSLTNANTNVLTVPASVTVQQGQTQVTFPITTAGVTQLTKVRITATAGTSSTWGEVTVLPVEVRGLTLTPSQVTAGAVVTGTVTLDAPSPAGGTVVTLMSADTLVAPVPGPITVPAGQSTAPFTINTKAAATPQQTIRLQARAYVTIRTADLHVTQINVSAFAIAPPAVYRTIGATGTVTLSAPAPDGGLVVNLTTGGPGSAPATVSIGAGQTTASFPITTMGGYGVQQVSIIAGVPGGSKSASLTVNPFAFNMSFDKPTVIGGSPFTATMTLTGEPAPIATFVSIGTDKPVATPQASQMFAGARGAMLQAGQSTLSFTVNTSPVQTESIVRVSITARGWTQFQDVRVQARK